MHHFSILGLNSGYPQLFQDCGETATTDVNSTGNSAHVSFRADGSTTTRGFKFQVVVLDGGQIYCYTLKKILSNDNITLYFGK